MANTKNVGDKSIAKILAMLLDRDYNVLIPFGDNQRYDLAVDLGDRFVRIQGKTGSIKNGAVHANANSVCKIKGRYVRKKYSKKEIDCFIVYCPNNGQFYKVDVDDKMPFEIVLRVEEPLSKSKNYKWAKDFEFESF